MLFSFSQHECSHGYIQTNKGAKQIAMKMRKKKRGRARFVCIRRRRALPTEIMRKIEQCEKIIKQKTCEMCGERDHDEKIILCDECDDAYHESCLGLQRSPQHQVWLCLNCIRSKSKKKQDIESKPDICAKCSGKAHEIPKLSYRCRGENKQIMMANSQLIECLFCHQHFHCHCFSKRNNSVNCWDCESKIRRSGPKNHYEHLAFLKNQQKVVEQRGYVELVGSEAGKKTRRACLMGLKLFEELTDWQLITRNEASLYYALQTRNLTFTQEQVYPSKQVMELNDSRKQIVRVHPLHVYDEKIYQLYKAKIKRGAILPFEVKEDRVVGFYLTALACISKNTIIFEYTGQVKSLRECLNEERHDSIFTLLITGSSKEDLNIASKQFGNMSRFVCGINNVEKKHRKKVNVASIRFSHKNRMRVIFITKRAIQKGETLYLDYNAGIFEEFPTANFV